MNNLIVFPIEVNGKELNFILDSGVGATILFNINTKDSLQLNNVKKIKLKGLGSEEAIDAILSKNNRFSFKNIVSQNQNLYVVFDDSFDLSSKLGLTIHGIIGYEILKDFVIKINYNLKKVTFYKPESYNYKKCKKCETFNLELYKLKPYINIGAKLDPLTNEITPVKLLIDSGGSDAMWLFENTHPNIVVPKKFFIDFLGEGLSGTIHGKRAFIKGLVLGKFELRNPTVSFPDSISIANALQFKSRNGSIGASILKRFIVIFDYKNEIITLRKGTSFKEPFRYNMSGIELAYNGKLLVKEQDYSNIVLSNKEEGVMKSSVVLNYNYKYTFKPTYKIFKLREGSPAYRAGLQENDIVIKINGKYTYNLKLEEIVEKFYQKENKKIKLVIERNGKDYEYQFELENMLK
ncbi:MAG: PDZ domain-containing protein [Lutibacter sp.]|uniref:PDZ domain-containing protein n=1 Tax=Lutibacter sp. TaxID=1925666 RepID=UPI0017DB7540|nr:PDZ domain-containing protein [Lutibacter sp.]MBT8316180.1 aspartyl protease family protein [Lutibacter sp.]NNJ57040.1 PDZ domain-containing protein [Lutibacter sp.]